MNELDLYNQFENALEEHQVWNLCCHLTTDAGGEEDQYHLTNFSKRRAGKLSDVFHNGLSRGYHHSDLF